MRWVSSQRGRDVLEKEREIRKQDLTVLIYRIIEVDGQDKGRNGTDKL